MSRRNISKKYSIVPDPIYNSILISMLITRILKNGKKEMAQKIIYKSLDIINNKTKKEPLLILEKAILNITPLIEVKIKRIGGSIYQVPIEVKAYRGINLALRWIVIYAIQRIGNNMIIKLANEIIDTANGNSNSIRKKEQTHKIAEANKAFIHYRY
uniref:Ribosomal protein S7 n=1 Tax=Choreocolax polysiphoniae TaxID=282351 RepID=A0A0B5W2H6_9FLOR|nr:30S ribosomal protein S7 [Choreocolax polysiphoniae]AJH65849.1 30S ribosomal protein S7 [Choreocolax polysiphoniae]